MTPAGAAETESPLASAPAPAKVNLYLHVTGRRPDGYHMLDSLVVFAGVGDCVEVYPAPENAPEITLEIAGPFAAALVDIEDNLVMQAARLLREAAGAAAGARIRLVKRLPVAAGIGGGSSDAAAALRALSAHWSGCPRGDDLARLALSLGADVPVCLFAKASLVGGIGEALTDTPALPAAYFTLVNPGEPLSTARVFAALEGRFSRPAPFAGAPGDAVELAGEISRHGNDLEAPARALVPAIGAVLNELAGEPGCLIARMSGSGPTCFGLFAEAGEAARAAARIAARRPGWWVADAPLLDDFNGLAKAP